MKDKIFIVGFELSVKLFHAPKNIPFDMDTLPLSFISCTFVSFPLFPFPFLPFLFISIRSIVIVKAILDRSSNERRLGPLLNHNENENVAK